jgi:hypothetical protein
MANFAIHEPKQYERNRNRSKFPAKRVETAVSAVRRAEHAFMANERDCNAQT